MHNQEVRKVYRKAIIKHEDAHHSFPFDNCYMPECKTVWEKMNISSASTVSKQVTDPKEQLELLAAHQEEFELFLKDLTGLNVTVSLIVHSRRNSETNLLNLFEASQSMDDFEIQSTSRTTWIAHVDFKRSLSVFMLDGFDADKLYPELDDDEGYAQAVEVENANKAHED